jgi:hypothetical protein
MKLDHARVSKITDILSKQIFSKITNDPMYKINKYLKGKLLTILPSTNQFAIELKLQIILKMKQEANYVMTLEDYEDIEKYCHDIIQIIDRLQVGLTHAYGHICHELVKTKLKLSELRGDEIDDVSTNLHALLNSL